VKQVFCAAAGALYYTLRPVTLRIAVGPAGSNDHKVIDKQEIEGLTAIAGNADEGKPGPIILQGDHGPVEFRKIILTPLVK